MPRFNNETRKKRIKELMRMLEKGLEVAKRDFDIAVGKDFTKLCIATFTAIAIRARNH